MDKPIEINVMKVVTTKGVRYCSVIEFEGVKISGPNRKTPKGATDILKIKLEKMFPVTMVVGGFNGKSGE